MPKFGKGEKAEACEALRELMVEVHDTREHGPRPKWVQGHGVQVHAIVRSVSKSGMSRRMDFFVMRNESATRITHHIARLLDWSQNPDKGLRVDGCGMDMGFHTLDCLKRAYERETGEVLPIDPQARYL